MGRQARVLRGPGHLADGEAVAVGRHEGEGVALDLHLDAGQQRKGLVAGGGDRDLADGLGEVVGVDRAGDAGHDGQRRVVVGGHGGQGEAGGAAGDGDLRALDLELDGLGGQGLGDVGEETAGDEDDAVLLDVGGDLAVGGDLVVEGCEDEGGVLGLEAHAGEDGHRRAGGHRAGGPGDGLGEDVSINPELHGGVPPVSAGGARVRGDWLVCGPARRPHDEVRRVRTIHVESRRKAGRSSTR